MTDGDRHGSRTDGDRLGSSRHGGDRHGSSRYGSDGVAAAAVAAEVTSEGAGVRRGCMRMTDCAALWVWYD